MQFEKPSLEKDFLKNMSGLCVSVIIPAKNETMTLDRCLRSLKKTDQPVECFVVGDHTSVQTAKKHSWVHTILSDASMEKAVNVGINSANHETILKLDADIQLPPDFFTIMLTKLNENSLLSCPATTRCSKTFLNVCFIGRDLLDTIAPAGRSSHGNSLFFKKSEVLKLGGFRYDTKLHQIYEKESLPICVVSSMRVYEFRETYSIQFIKKQQLASGKARHQLGIGFFRTLFHSISRLRFFVLAGWMQEELVPT